MILETEKHLQILEALARYKFLTVSQMLKLGLGGQKNHKQYLQRILKQTRERKRPTLACIKFDGTYKYQKREYVYYLTKRGVEQLLNNTELENHHINRPVGTSSLFERDYTHRMMHIDMMISLYSWCEFKQSKVIFFDSYYDYESTQKRGAPISKTNVTIDSERGTRIIPDGIYLIQKSSGKYELFAWEIHMGRDKQRIMRQLVAHKTAIQQGAISYKYGLVNKDQDCRETGLANRVVVIFEHKSTMKNTIEAVRKSQDISEAFYPYFLFGWYEEVIQDFAGIELNQIS